MAYFPDLSTWSYFGAEDAHQLIAVGWLDSDLPFPNGHSDEIFVDKLIGLLIKPWAPMYLLGFAECPFCTLDSYSVIRSLAKDSAFAPFATHYLLLRMRFDAHSSNRLRITYKGKTIVVGALNLFVPGDGFLYAGPSMIAHYILTHNYMPPQEFRDAVVRCPPMSSPEYFAAIRQHGQQVSPMRLSLTSNNSLPAYLSTQSNLAMG